MRKVTALLVLKFLPVCSACVAPTARSILTESVAQDEVQSDIYVRSFGKESDQPIIFVHGGPGFHSYDFEKAAAAELAQLGFRVVVYDQRGQGRSGDAESSAFTYRRYAEDLMQIIRAYRLKAPILIGHSHGGPITIAFTKQFPGVARKVVLASAPVNFSAAIESMMDNCDAVYRENGDNDGIANIAFIRDHLANRYADMTTEQRVGIVATLFQYHALQRCKLYEPRVSTPQATALRRLVYVDEPLRLPDGTGLKAMPGFLANENYIRRNWLSDVRANPGLFCGVYGNEDGLFTQSVLSEIAAAVGDGEGDDRFAIVTGASHGLYIDQREKFFAAMRDVCGF